MVFFSLKKKKKKQDLKIDAAVITSHPGKDAPQKIRSTPAEYHSPGENVWETASVCHKPFKKLKL